MFASGCLVYHSISLNLSFSPKITESLINVVVGRSHEKTAQEAGETGYQRSDHHDAMKQRDQCRSICFSML